MNPLSRSPTSPRARLPACPGMNGRSSDKVKAVGHRQAHQGHWAEQDEQPNVGGKTKTDQRGRSPGLQWVVGQVEAVTEPAQRDRGARLEGASNQDLSGGTWARKPAVTAPTKASRTARLFAIIRPTGRASGRTRGAKAASGGRAPRPRRGRTGRRTRSTHIRGRWRHDENGARPTANASTTPSPSAPPPPGPEQGRQQEIDLPLRGHAPHRRVDLVGPLPADIVDQKEWETIVRHERRQRHLTPARVALV